MNDAPSHAVRLLGMNERIKRDTPGVVDAAIALAQARNMFPDDVIEITSGNTSQFWLNCGPYRKSPTPSAVRPTSHTSRCHGNFYLMVRHTGIHLAKPSAIVAMTVGSASGSDLQVSSDEYAALIAIHEDFKNV